MSLWSVFASWIVARLDSDALYQYLSQILHLFRGCLLFGLLCPLRLTFPVSILLCQQLIHLVSLAARGELHQTPTSTHLHTIWILDLWPRALVCLKSEIKLLNLQAFYWNCRTSLVLCEICLAQPAHGISIIIHMDVVQPRSYSSAYAAAVELLIVTQDDDVQNVQERKLPSAKDLAQDPSGTSHPKSRLVSFKVVVLLISTNFLHSPGHGGSTSAVAWPKRFNSSFIFEAKFRHSSKGTEVPPQGARWRHCIHHLILLGE